MIENQLGMKIKGFQSDGGLEYSPFTKYLNSFGITHRFSCPYTHEQNGSVERKHRHITEMGLTMLANAHMPLKFWGEAFQTATSLIACQHLSCKIFHLLRCYSSNHPATLICALLVVLAIPI